MCTTLIIAPMFYKYFNKYLVITYKTHRKIIYKHNYYKNKHILKYNK